MHGGESLFKTAPLFVYNVIEKRLWASRKDINGKVFRYFEDFVAHRLWEGLGTTIDNLKLYCRDAPTPSP
jgi:hypothetical protein